MLALGAVVASLPARAETAPEGEITFFDALVTLGPGISREVDVTVDHIRGSDSRLTMSSVKLQYPFLPWCQLSLEMPVVVLEQDGESTQVGAGDLVLVGQAVVWQSAPRRAQVNLGVELTLPTGNKTVLAGSTAVRPFAAGGIKLGPVDVLGNLSYAWVVGGPASGGQFFQANAAVGYPLAWLTPFVELNLLKPVAGFEDSRVQLYALPGFEVTFPGGVTLSLGTQLPLTSARAANVRALALLKWPF
jgi:hypothetical protein